MLTILFEDEKLFLYLTSLSQRYYYGHP